MPRVDRARLQRASACLGELVVDPSLWPMLMHEICQAIGAEGAALLQADVRTPDVPVTEGVKDFFAFYFREGWHQHDLRAATAPLLLAGRSVTRRNRTPGGGSSKFFNSAFDAAALSPSAGRTTMALPVA